jgi:hypothetical protein
MSERYGAPGELKEKFEELENYVRAELEEAKTVLRGGDGGAFSAGRLDALRDVLDFMGVSGQ